MDVDGNSSNSSSLMTADSPQLREHEVEEKKEQNGAHQTVKKQKVIKEDELGDDMTRKLLRNNQKWVEEITRNAPDYFLTLAKQQSPEILWIGCSDSRVPANQITGTRPGEIFVHRNIANMVVHSDMNMLSVLSYAVEVLKVRHVIVCGHYGCGGVIAAMGNKQFGLIDNWLRHIKDVYMLHHHELDNISDLNERGRRLVEINVLEQVHDLCKTSIVQNAWKKKQSLTVHGWVYDISDGLIKDLNHSVADETQLSAVYKFDL